MILTVTLNPSIDKTFEIPNYSINKLNRTDMPQIIAGGKGINAAIVLKLFKEEVVATGFLGDLTGRKVGEYLRSKDITTNFAQIEGSTRTNYIVLDRRKQTQINEKGPKIEPDELESFMDIYEMALSHAKFVIMAGSIPPGIDVDIYKSLARKAKHKNINVFLNTSGEALERAVEAAPYIVKPDIRVREKVLGITLDSIKNKIRAANKIMSDGAQIVMFSEGIIGELIVSKGKAFIAKPEKDTLKSRIGVQDSIIGAFTYGMVNNMSLENAAKIAVCAGKAAGDRMVNTPESSKEIEMCQKNILIEEVS